MKLPFSTELPPDLTEIDPHIRKLVVRLNRLGVRTFAACDGGPGHSFKHPSIRIYGATHEAMRAIELIQETGAPLMDVALNFLIVQHGEWGPSLLPDCWTFEFNDDWEQWPRELLIGPAA